MGVGEFLSEFRRDFKIQKTEAHRKKVVEKKRKNDLKSGKVTIQSIKEDNSANMKNSHTRLQTMIIEHETIFQTTAYSKKELQLLCKAYGVVFKKSDSKGKLSEKLIPTIRVSQNITYPFVLNDSTHQPGTSTSALTVQGIPAGYDVANEEASEQNQTTNHIDQRTCANAVCGLTYQPTRKRFKPSMEEEEVLCQDQQKSVSMEKAYERAVQFNTSLKAIVAWHEKHLPK